LGEDSKEQNNLKQLSPGESWYAWNFTTIIAIIASIIIPLGIYYFPKSEPKFIIVNSILRSDSTILIKANNEKANKKENLDIIFDGCSFPKKGITINSNSDDGMQQWHFTLKDHKTFKSMLKDGKHWI